MRRLILFLSIPLCLTVLLHSCEQIDHDGDYEIRDLGPVSPADVARMLSCLPLEDEILREVYDAVNASCSNGYDEEYTMENLFTLPGSGVGDSYTKAQTRSYGLPLRDLISSYLASGTKAESEDFSAEDLQNSGLQLYWPWSDKWDGSSYPTITFDPGDGSSKNIGYRLSRTQDGTLQVQELVVNEEYASKNPVWVVNANDDAAYKSLELMRKELGGGDIIIGKKPAVTKAEETKLTTLVIKDFTMLRNYDSWLCGGSEFFIKCASVENFTAATEAELLLYKPTITDMMICIPRKDLGVTKTINAVLADNWTEYETDGQSCGMERCALMIIEDDGGTWTDWTIDADVKIKSKTYGLTISIPVRSRDDIVWRGTLSGNYLRKYSGEKGRFGDVEITFEMLEK